MKKAPKYCAECGAPLIKTIIPDASNIERVIVYCPVWDKMTIQVPRAHTYLTVEERERKPKFNPDTGELLNG